MDNKELLKLLGEDEACKPAMIKARNMSVPQLLKLYIDNVDHVVNSKLLTADFLRRYATEEQLTEAGIYIGKFGSLQPSEVLVLINCELRILAKSFDVSRIYLLGRSRLLIDTTDDSIVFIDVHDQSRCVIHNRGKNYQTVSVNSHEASAENTGNVKIRKS